MQLGGTLGTLIICEGPLLKDQGGGRRMDPLHVPHLRAYHGPGENLFTKTSPRAAYSGPAMLFYTNYPRVGIYLRGLG